MKKENGVSIKLGKSFRDFLDNTRATRRSKVIGTDKDMLSLPETCGLLESYFKAYPVRFQELIKFQVEKQC